MTHEVRICDWCGAREERIGPEGNINTYGLPVRCLGYMTDPVKNIMLCYECAKPIFDLVEARMAERKA